MDVARKMTRSVQIGGVLIGNQAPIAIQSMTNTRTEDVDDTVEQIKRLEDAGCDIVRSSIYSQECAVALRRIKQSISIPIVADVHFDHRLAVSAIENGADKLRINPGNISRPEYISMVTDCAKAHHIPIRIGVNMGSLNSEIEAKYGRSARALVASAVQNVKMLEERGFYDIVISVKASNVSTMVESYELLSSELDYPLHLGVTEAGDVYSGTVKNAIGMGSLLLKGIGDTVRVSLTGDPVQEIYAAKEILRAVGSYNKGIEIISCPTCGRTRFDLEKAVSKVKEATKNINRSLKVAIMGCVVNGPGEAKDADIGIAGGGNGSGILFIRGERVAVLPDEELISELLRRINNWQD